jgi:hypothetical protein
MALRSSLLPEKATYKAAGGIGECLLGLHHDGFATADLVCNFKQEAAAVRHPCRATRLKASVGPDY